MTELAKQVERLYARRRFGIKPGLDAERELLARLGHPEQGLAAIHVAGTNGKGSLCALLDAVLNAAGYRVGCYTSPHLVRFNERYRVAGEAIDDAALEGLMAAVEQVAEAREAEGHPPLTFFECATAMAFRHFEERRIQLAILETGMGGRLDATNVVTPLISVITRIGLDHTAWLGADLETIAGEKAGIIKQGRPVVIGAMPASARAVLLRVAAEQGAPVVDVEALVTVERVSGSLRQQKLRISSRTMDYGTVQTPLAAAYQMENMATAVAVTECLRDTIGLPCPAAAVSQGLAEAVWPGRFQLIADDPPLLIDGAHNCDGALALVQALRQAKAPRRVALVVGVCDDKDVDGFFAAWGKLRPACWAVPLANPRGLAPARVAEAARRHGLEARVATLSGALDAARQWAREHDGMVTVAGSLFLIGEVLDALDPAN